MAEQADAQRIRQLEDQRYAAMIAGDDATLDRLLDADMVYTHSTGTADTKASYLDGVRSKLWKYQTVDRSDESIVTRPGVALVFNRVRISILVSGTPKQLDNRMVAVWAPSPGGDWRLIAVHSTPAPR